jgi:cyanophycinase
MEQRMSYSKVIPQRLIFGLLLFGLFSGGADASVTRYTTGSAADVHPTLSGPAYDFGGGSTDVEPALQWIIDQVRGCSDCSTKIDFVILRSSGEDGYNEMIYGMNGVDSVETLVITSRNDANRRDVEDTIKNAEVIFFAGGDQCDYVTNFKGTKVQSAMESVYARGGGMGGTSAGLAIMSDFVFNACSDTAVSAVTLNNPYDKTVRFTYDFLKLDFMSDTITDQHFVPRDRMGRRLTFLARQIQDGKAQSVLGVAVNEKTSVVVSKDGKARVIGQGPAYFILADHPPEKCLKKQPLTYSNFKIWKILTDGTFDLKARPDQGYYTRSVMNGKIDSDPY